jgi:O-antigen ligase
MIVRTENKRKLSVYLADKPFGGGVASAGDWGKRYKPDSILANIATDSFYVRIWAETGIIGLLLFLTFFFYFIIRGGWIIWKMNTDPPLRNKLLALYCGVIGIMAASYGNSVFSQFPTSMISYSSMCFILIAEKYWIKKSN